MRVNKHRNVKGFTLLETVVALLILTIAMLAAVSSVTFAIQYSQTAKKIGTAKTIVVSTLEEIESLSNSKKLEFKQIANEGSTDNRGLKFSFSGFVKDFRQVEENPGDDKIGGTADDVLPAETNPAEQSDSSKIFAGFQRQIIISDLTSNAKIKRVEVRVKYVSNSIQTAELSGVTFINKELNFSK